MRALLLLLLLAGCAYFEPPQPAAPPDAASQAIILEWALWGDRPRAQYREQPPESLPYPVERFGYSYPAGRSRNFIRY